MRPRLREYLPLWSGDDSRRGGSADLDRHRPHRYAQGHAWFALLVQEGLGRDPFAGDVFVFGGRSGQMSYLLEAIDWRNPQHTWRPQSAG
jgi:hypothetical protein